MSSVGGVDDKFHIRRILSKLLTNKFAVEKNVSNSKIEDLNIIALIESVKCYLFAGIFLCTYLK